MKKAAETVTAVVDTTDQSRDLTTTAEVVLDITDECKVLPKNVSEIDKKFDCKLHECRASGDVQNTIPVQSRSHSNSEEICCRICQEEGTSEKLISPCFCQGSVGYMHFSCLERWLQTNRRTDCELCSYPFRVQTVMPSVRQFLRHPAQNMDMPSFICDVSCFFLLTPLLVASTYLCCTRLTSYHGAGKSETTFAIATLIISLITVYSAWAALAVLYHRRVWLVWRERNAKIHLLIDPAEPLVQDKCPKKSEAELQPALTDVREKASHQESTSALLRPTPMLQKEVMSKPCDAWTV